MAILDVAAVVGDLWHFVALLLLDLLAVNWTVVESHLLMLGLIVRLYCLILVDMMFLHVCDHRLVSALDLRLHNLGQFSLALILWVTKALLSDQSVELLNHRS